uniref:Uncharacterized protein n=1 Tax=candidate division WOR-3 bacterium TaxID=2052148 RepID=A0A7C4GB89_UNCW3
MVIPEFGAVEFERADAIPLEYRYSTGLLGVFAAGSALSLLALFVMRGPVAVLLVLVALPMLLFGIVGMSADPSGIIRSAGKRLVIDDRLLQEVDELGRVKWSIAPGQVQDVRKEAGRPVLPLGAGSWRAESWHVVLDDGRIVRICVWLLPDRGRQFKQRFQSFIQRRGRTQASGTRA